jgi:hypothetical protein
MRTVTFNRITLLVVLCVVLVTPTVASALSVTLDARTLGGTLVQSVDLPVNNTVVNNEVVVFLDLPPLSGSTTRRPRLLPAGCDTTPDPSFPGVCLRIEANSKAVFVVDSSQVGQLVTRSFVVRSIGTGGARLRLFATHTNLAANGQLDRCVGMSADGYVQTQNYVSPVGFKLTMNMNVRYFKSGGTVIGPFFVGQRAPGSCPVPAGIATNVAGGTDLIFTSPSPGDQDYTGTSDDGFYNPLDPTSIIDKIPGQSSADPSKGAEIRKTLLLDFPAPTTTTGWYRNTMTGSATAWERQCVDHKRDNEGRTSVPCTAEAQAGITALHARFSCRSVLKPGVSPNKISTAGGSGGVLVDVECNDDLDPNVDIDPETCLLFPERLYPSGGTAPKTWERHFDQRYLRLQYERAELPLQVGDELVVHTCDAGAVKLIMQDAVLVEQ